MLSGPGFIKSVVADHYKQPETLTASNASLEYVCRFQVETVTSVVHTTPIVETLTLGVLRARGRRRYHTGPLIRSSEIARSMPLCRIIALAYPCE